MRRHLGVLKRVAANPALRRIQIAFLGFSCAENGVWVSVLVYAFERGGTTLAASIAVIQLLPAAAVAPVASTLADRRGGAVGLWVGYLAQALSVAATAALMLSGAPSVAAYAAAVVAACAVTFTRPAHAALLPLLVDDPRELTAANVVTGWFDSSSFLLGPATAGILIGLDGPGLSCAVFAGVVLLSAFAVAPLVQRRDLTATATAVATTTSPAGAQDVPEGAPTVLRAIRGEPGASTLLGTVALQYIGLGALDVLVVVIAIKLLALGPSGAGYLNAAFGAGGVVGGALALGLIGRSRLVPPLVLGGLVWGGAFVLLGAWPTAAGAFALLACAGASRTVLDVSGRTLLQRAVPAEVRARVFGVLEGASMLGLAVGSASVPLLAYVGGPRASVAGIGIVLAGACGAGAPLLSRLQGSAPSVETELALLRSSSIFGVLAAPELEDLAQSLILEHFDAGDPVVREGERGDRYYLVGTGRLIVTVRGKQTRELGPGDGFGEIALLRDGLRTATVTPTEPVALYALERTAFLNAVTGSTHARGGAERLVAERLEGDAHVVEGI